jgi:hypothetical protein
MTTRKLHRTFALFHATLGIVVLVESVRTMLHAVGVSGGHPMNLGLAVFAGVEAGAAVLFLLPATTRLGAAVLVVVFVIALGLHLLEGQWQSPLLVYAAGAAFVMRHGSVFGKRHDRWAAPV